MAAREEPWESISAPSPNFQVRLHGVTFHLNKECMASRSAKLAKLLKNTHHLDLSSSDSSIAVDRKSFELAARFCYSGNTELSSDTVIPLACAASALEMIESHSQNNLLSLCTNYLSLSVLPYWNQTITALRAAVPVLAATFKLGLIEPCIKSIVKHAIADHRFVSPREEERSAAVAASARIRRKLFTAAKSNGEDLTDLHVNLFKLAVESMSQAGVRPDHLANCVNHFAERWIYPGITEESTVCDRNKLRDLVEAVEKMLPDVRGSLPVGSLVKLLRAAVFLQACSKCRAGIEARIAFQLPDATAGDLLVPAIGYASETKYDVECAERIMQGFLLHHHSDPDAVALAAATTAVETFVCSVASDRDLSKTKFVQLIEPLAAMADELGGTHDGLYRAIDVYFGAHAGLVESERELICRRLDAMKMSAEACEHAAQNSRMPMRMVAQVLFVGQLRIREAIAEANFEDDDDGDEEEDEVDGEEKRVVESSNGAGADVTAGVEEEKVDIENDGRNKKIVVELEKKKEKEKRKWKWWKDIFGCKSGLNVKKKVHSC